MSINDNSESGLSKTDASYSNSSISSKDSESSDNAHRLYKKRKSMYKRKKTINEDIQHPLEVARIRDAEYGINPMALNDARTRVLF